MLNGPVKVTDLLIAFVDGGIRPVIASIPQHVVPASLLVPPMRSACDGIGDASRAVPQAFSQDTRCSAASRSAGSHACKVAASGSICSHAIIGRGGGNGEDVQQKSDGISG